MTIREYDKAIKTRQEKIACLYRKAIREVSEFADKKNEEHKQWAQRLNEAPCTVCNSSEYVIKYREIVGKITGKTSGYFSLFGGSISGYIDGNISTKPVLSCRECGNEKLIQIPKHTHYKDLIVNQMPSILLYSNTSCMAKSWLIKKGLEVARLLAKDCYFEYYSQDINEFSDEKLKEVGLVNKYPLPKKPLLYWLRKQLQTNKDYHIK